jgi:hypothetical protein
MTKTDFPGNDITVVRPVSTWQECAQICLDIPDCIVWTLDKRENQNRCIPKSKDGGTLHLNDHISGTRECTPKATTTETSTTTSPSYILSTTDSECPPDWTSLDTGCYFYIPGHFNWFDARDACENINSKLVELETMEEKGPIGQVLPNGPSRPHGVWMGLSDIAEEGTWIWNSSGEKATWTAWAKGGPTNNGDCAILLLHGMEAPGQWTDGFCLMVMNGGAVCELPK